MIGTGVSHSQWTRLRCAYTLCSLQGMDDRDCLPSCLLDIYSITPQCNLPISHMCSQEAPALKCPVSLDTHYHGIGIHPPSCQIAVRPGQQMALASWQFSQTSFYLNFGSASDWMEEPERRSRKESAFGVLIPSRPGPGERDMLRAVGKHQLGIYLLWTDRS